MKMAHFRNALAAFYVATVAVAQETFEFSCAESHGIALVRQYGRARFGLSTLAQQDGDSPLANLLDSPGECAPNGWSWNAEQPACIGYTAPPGVDNFNFPYALFLAGEPFCWGDLVDGSQYRITNVCADDTTLSYRMVGAGDGCPEMIGGEIIDYCRETFVVTMFSDLAELETLLLAGCDLDEEPNLSNGYCISSATEALFAKCSIDSETEPNPVFGAATSTAITATAAPTGSPSVEPTATTATAAPTGSPSVEPTTTTATAAPTGSPSVEPTDRPAVGQGSGGQRLFTGSIGVLGLVWLSLILLFRSADGE